METVTCRRCGWSEQRPENSLEAFVCRCDRDWFCPVCSCKWQQPGRETPRCPKCHPPQQPNQIPGRWTVVDATAIEGQHRYDFRRVPQQGDPPRVDTESMEIRILAGPGLFTLGTAYTFTATPLPGVVVNN